MAKRERASEIEHTDAPRDQCGVVMPISSIAGLEERHWSDVYSILASAIDSAGFTARMVSSSDEVGVIQKRIVQNLYNDPIVVCDVSGKNPNVMFELGMRLAFDKPTVIVKDDKTDYSFDTGIIEHIEYPRDLRHPLVETFKIRLAEKVRATSEEAARGSTFLKSFGAFTVANLQSKELPGGEFIIEELRGLRDLVGRLEARSRTPAIRVGRGLGPGMEAYVTSRFAFSDIETAHRAAAMAKSMEGVLETIVFASLVGGATVSVTWKSDASDEHRHAVRTAMEALSSM